MRKLRSRLPPPNALVAFEAVARHLSFTKAAEELNVTRVAASSHVKNLEAFIGVKLFDRMHRALRLTSEGEALALSVSESLEAIVKTIDVITAPDVENRLTVTASPSMATNWLMPRISAFRRGFPDLDIRFIVSEQYVDLSREGIDVGIRYGDGHWDGVEARRLTQVLLTPLCSPAYFGDRDRLTDPEALRDEKLLHLTDPYEPEMRWSNWFRSHGVDAAPASPGLTFDDHHSLVQAALQGQGVALLGWPAVSLQMSEGRLTRPIVMPPTAHRHIWLILPSGRRVNAITQAFCDWVGEEMSGDPPL